MSKWNKTVTRDLPALIGSLHGFCDVDDVTYVLNGIRLGLVKLGQEQRHRYPEMSDADEVAHKVLNQVEKQLAAIIKKWKPSWDPKYKDQQ